MAPPKQKKNPKEEMLSKQVLDLIKKRKAAASSSSEDESQISVAALKKHLKKRKINDSGASSSTTRIVDVVPKPDVNPQTESSSDSDCSSSKENANESENESENSDLFGKNYGKMVHIGKGIYCRKQYIDLAMGTSHKATHVVRKLLEGVFKLEALLVSTRTGYSARAHGKELQNKPMKPLNETAKSAIIEFAMKVATEKGWLPQTVREVQNSMTQRLCEIKDAYKKSLQKES